MPEVSLQTYASLLTKSGLFSDEDVADQLDQFLASLESRCDKIDSAEHPAELFAAFLQDSGLVTQWQNNHLLLGRYRGLMFGKFRVLRLLGAGGMGRVFLAHDQLLDRQIALKILPKKKSEKETSIQRFQREARALAKLDHVNIVRVHDVDYRDDTHYIVMEYVPGRDLAEYIKRSGPLDEPEAIDLIAQAARGLDHAHQAGLIHRDIKPANLLLDESGVVKILDYGLAMLQSDDNPAITADPTKTLGTVDYLSPEQALNSHELDQRTDIYSLGCTLHFLLTGSGPFSAGTNTQRLLAHQNQTPPSIDEARAAIDLEPISDSLKQICARMMEKRPEDRFGSAGDVVAALKACQTGVASGVASSAGSKNRTAIDIQIKTEKRHSIGATLDTQSISQLNTISESLQPSPVPARPHALKDVAEGGAAHSGSKSGLDRGQSSLDRGQSSLGRGQGRRRAIPFIALSILLVCVAATAGIVFWGDPLDGGLNDSGEAVQAISWGEMKVGTFYRVGDNRTYHVRGCRHAEGKTNLLAVSGDDLDGLKPCGSCKPHLVVAPGKNITSR